MEPLQDWRSPQFEEQLSRLDRGGITFEFLRRKSNIAKTIMPWRKPSSREGLRSVRR